MGVEIIILWGGLTSLTYFDTVLFVAGVDICFSPFYLASGFSEMIHSRANQIRQVSGGFREHFSVRFDRQDFLLHFGLESLATLYKPTILLGANIIQIYK